MLQTSSSSMGTSQLGEVLRTDHISKSFGGMNAINDVTLDFVPGRITAVVGPNGAGKTTLFHVMSGFLSPDAGSVWLGQTNLTDLSAHRIARRGLARTFQEVRLIRRLSVVENVLLAMSPCAGERLVWALLSPWGSAEKRRRANAMTMLESVGLADYREQFAEELSYGQQKLLCLACCLASDSKWLLLDEPVAGVSQETVSDLVHHISELSSTGMSVLFIEHNMDVVRNLADRIIVMDRGEVLCDGDWDTVSNDPRVLEAYLK